MYNTPASRTSRHGSSKKQRRSRQAQSQLDTTMEKQSIPETTKALDTTAEAEVEIVRDEVREGDTEIDEGHVEELGSYAENAQDVGEEAEEEEIEGLDTVWFEESMAALEEQPGVQCTQTTKNPTDVQEDTLVDVEVDNERPAEDHTPMQPATFGQVPDNAPGVVQDPHTPKEFHDVCFEENGSTNNKSLDNSRREFPPAAFTGGSGHVRAPIIARHSSTASSLSRQIKNVQSYLPASPQLPTFGLSNLSLTSFSAPGITNVTVSGSGFNRPQPRTMSDPFVTSKEARRRSTGMYGDRDRDRARLRMTSATPNDESDGDDSTPVSMVRRSQETGVSSRGGQDKVVFASFLSLSIGNSSSMPRRLLFIGYENGLQIWDATSLGEVQEVLNQRLSGSVVFGAVLPTPRGAVNDMPLDEFAKIRPLIGVVIEEHSSSYLLVYSLATHEVVRKLVFSGAHVVSFKASPSFIAVSTIYPISLQILNTRTFNILHTIHDPNLVTFSRPITQPSQQASGTGEPIYFSRQDQPHAVYALSSRLLAYGSTAPTSSDSSRSQNAAHTAVPQSPSLQLGPLNVSQADIGNAALKVGGGLLSGMKVLGGFAVAAARGESLTTAYTEKSGGLRGLFSRNAPVNVPSHARRRTDLSETDAFRTGGDSQIKKPMVPSVKPASVVHVSVVDLQPLLEDVVDGQPEPVMDLPLHTGQSLAGLEFSDDGQSVAIIPLDGGIVRVFQIRPMPRAVRSSICASDDHGTVRARSPSNFTSHEHISRAEGSGQTNTELDDDASGIPWHVYDLRRGRTNGVIEHVQFSVDNRWVAVSTRKRTVHVFATNPYWGKPDESSHLEGKVRNALTLQPLSTELSPIVRLRSVPVASADQLVVPLAFSFIACSTTAVPPKYLPSPLSFSSPQSVISSLPSSPPNRSRRTSSSPQPPPRPTNYQDAVIFDPVDGKLTLHRITVATQSGEIGTSILSSLPLPAGTSISLPGMSFSMRPSSSPSKSTSTPSRPASRTELASELTASGSPVVSWNLLREKNWKEVKAPLPRSQTMPSRQVLNKSEWLSQAELSTSSQSPRILPSSVYLSHQFSFYALSEDYHALIRRFHFDIPALKIEARREVEASTYTSGQGELFVSAGSSPQEIRQARSTLDAPLASAMSVGLDYSSTSSPIIPMLPNGARPGSFKASIPIRNVAAGLTESVNEGFGRLRREMYRVRSPRLRPQPEDRTPGPVPLEFEEDDEMFLNQNELDSRERDDDAQSGGGTSRGDSAASISTPSTNNNVPLPDNEPEGWSLDDMDGLDEAERFDEISAAGLMDEEQMPIRVPGQKHTFGRKGI